MSEAFTCLVLGGGGDPTVAGQMGQKIGQFRLGHFLGMPFSVVQNETANPIAVGSLRPNAKMFASDDITDLIEEFRLVAGRRGD